MQTKAVNIAKFMNTLKKDGMKMVIRQIREEQWESIYHQITTYGRAAPLSLQYDVDLTCNGVQYILKVQPDSKRKLAALQALGMYPHGGGAHGEDCLLIEDNAILAALLELLVFQGAVPRGA